MAAYFQKEHKHVLRDIDKLVAGGPNLGDQHFQEVSSFNPAANKVTRHFDMTKRGFTLLIFGWEGEKAMSFKIAYLDRFEAMEKALREPRGPVLPDLSNPAQAARAWAVEFEGGGRLVLPKKCEGGLIYRRAGMSPRAPTRTARDTGTRDGGHARG